MPAGQRLSDVVFKGVVGTLGLVTAGSLLWFGATGVNIVSTTNTNLQKQNEERRASDHGAAR
jgi:hypothetical protein